MSLTFNALRSANVARVGTFTNRYQQRVHDKDDGSDWTAAQWFQAMVGEVGEYANFRKKFERGDIDWVTFHAEAKRELADVQIYLDLLAYRLGIDLGEATREKFNEVSARIRSGVRL